MAEWRKGTPKTIAIGWHEDVEVTPIEDATGEIALFYDDADADLLIADHQAAKSLAIAEKALELLHDKMDDYNAGHNIGIEAPYCYWCAHAPGYDGNGLKHFGDCPLLVAREALSGIKKLKEDVKG